MNVQQAPDHARILMWAGLLSLFGLLTGVGFVLNFTPYTMVFFLMGGQGLIFIAVCLFAYAVWCEIRSRMQSIVEKRYKAGEVIFHQGDYPDRLYVIGKGEVEVLQQSPGKEDLLLARLGKDQIFGEIGILGDTPRTATVRAASDVDVLSIHRSYFNSLFSYLPVLREKILAAYRSRIA